MSAFNFFDSKRLCSWGTWTLSVSALNTGERKVVPRAGHWDTLPSPAELEGKYMHKQNIPLRSPFSSWHTKHKTCYSGRGILCSCEVHLLKSDIKMPVVIIASQGEKITLSFLAVNPHTPSKATLNKTTLVFSEFSKK